MVPFLENYPLLAHNTFHLSSSASYYYEYSSIEELKEVLQSSILKENRLLHIGGGSNLLFTKDYDGVVLHSAIRGIAKIKENDDFIYLKVGAGIVWDNFVAHCVENNWYGAENLSLIPGEVGAAAVQNIGAYGVEIKDLIEEVYTLEVSTGKERLFSQEECQYAYRESIFKKELKEQYIITHVLFRLNKKAAFHLEYGNLSSLLTSEITLSEVREVVISVRESKLPDPRIIGNAGSFFMNPYITTSHYEQLLERYPNMPHYPVSETEVKVPAAWLIEQCGWKGKMMGGAAVHDKQCLVIINKESASAQDIVDLSAAIRQSVMERFAVPLIPEVIFI